MHSHAWDSLPVATMYPTNVCGYCQLQQRPSRLHKRIALCRTEVSPPRVTPVLCRPGAHVSNPQVTKSPVRLPSRPSSRSPLFPSLCAVQSPRENKVSVY